MNLDAAQSEAADAWLRESLEIYAVNRDVRLRDEIALRTSWIATRSARRFWDRGASHLMISSKWRRWVC